MKKYFLDFIVAIICTLLFLVYSLIDNINNYLVFLPNIPKHISLRKNGRRNLEDSIKRNMDKLPFITGDSYAYW